jgi:dolichol-phosphate mannosyltransferase
MMAGPQATVTGPELSIVVPCFNEEANLRPLVSALRAVLELMVVTYEIILVDDRSTDNSWAVLKELAAADPRVRGLKLERNSGQSAALWAGLRDARGRYIATLDADMQNDPRDLPEFWKALKHADCVCGSRVESRGEGDGFIRIISSLIANGVRNKLSGENISDAGCCYRVFKRECVADLKFFKGIHRFLPTLIKMEGFTVTEIPVRHNPRVAGESKYGVWNRLFASFYDLLAVRWMKKRMFRFQVAEFTVHRYRLFKWHSPRDPCFSFVSPALCSQQGRCSSSFAASNPAA